jgi:predicted phosphodiesterase
MRYLIISDLHSNLEALESVLVEASGQYDQVACCGDLVGYGPDPGAVIRRVKNLGCLVVRGNHDKGVLGQTDLSYFNPMARQAVYWTREVLSPEDWAYLREVPAGPRVVSDFLLVHGSLQDEDEYLYTISGAFASFQISWMPLVFMGHTHVQGGYVKDGSGIIAELSSQQTKENRKKGLQLESGCQYLINPGSVGQPRDQDPRAAFVLYNDDEKQIYFGRASYPIAETQAKMKAAQLPEPLIERLSRGR